MTHLEASHQAARTAQMKAHRRPHGAGTCVRRTSCRSRWRGRSRREGLKEQSRRGRPTGPRGCRGGGSNSARNPQGRGQRRRRRRRQLWAAPAASAAVGGIRCACSRRPSRRRNHRKSDDRGQRTVRGPHDCPACAECGRSLPRRATRARAWLWISQPRAVCALHDARPTHPLCAAAARLWHREESGWQLVGREHAVAVACRARAGCASCAGRARPHAAPRATPGRLRRPQARPWPRRRPEHPGPPPKRVATPAASQHSPCRKRWTVTT